MVIHEINGPVGDRILQGRWHACMVSLILYCTFKAYYVSYTNLIEAGFLRTFQIECNFKLE